MPKRVLIVEDYADARKLMKYLVNQYDNSDVIEAENGREAIEQAQKHKPDLILMDLSMPLMDGVTATQIIRNLAGFENIPIIALTAYSHSLKDRAIAGGCDDVFEKPLDSGKLQSIFDKYLK